MVWSMTFSFAWYHKLHHVACGIAFFGFVSFGIVTFAVYQSIDMPKKYILWLFVFAYTIPILVGLCYEQFYNTKEKQNRQTRKIEFESGDTT